MQQWVPMLPMNARANDGMAKGDITILSGCSSVVYDVLQLESSSTFVKPHSCVHASVDNLLSFEHNKHSCFEGEAFFGTGFPLGLHRSQAAQVSMMGFKPSEGRYRPMERKEA